MNTRFELTIEGMTCEGCAASVRKALRRVPGFVGADIDVASGAARIRYEGAGPGPEGVQSAIEGAGFDVVGSVQLTQGEG